jgi:hypothetical protein
LLAKTNAVHEAWAAAERTLDFKVTVNGTTYTATDITELDFDAGAMNGDALTLGSTYANTVKIVFSHLVEGLALTNEITPEIGIQLPDGTWDYTALGVFVIDSQVEQDRNNNTTTVSATDRFVMMGGTYTSKLDYPADVLDVATEIADQAGVQINATDIGHLPAAQVPSAIAGATLREAIGFVAQFCAGFATFDRDGQLSIRTLNDPEFTITTNQYQSKGLTKNEVMYQVDGLTCEVEARDDAGSSDTVTLQSGNTTGNQIVLTNPVMTQNALDGLYTQLQDTNFYPFSLDWFGDPSVEVGDWIEIVDAAGNKFKTPNLLFALTFNGSLTATSKADTTVTANSNFSYVNTNNKRIIRDLRARIDASGHKITDGTEAPENPKLGDIWFAKDGPDTIIRIWTLNPDTGEAYWKDEVSTKTTSDIAAQIDEIMKQLKADEDALAEKLAANDAAQTVLNGKLDDNAAAITKAKQDTDSAVADVTAKVKQAADDTAKAVAQADDAAETATNALTVAQSASATSDDAKATAASAADDAAKAQADANAAQDNAVGAVTNAQTALDNAADALAQAQNALKSGQDALSGVEGLRNSSSINLIVPTEHTMHPGVWWGEMDLGTFTPDYNSDGTYTIQLDVECPELEGPTLSTEIGFRVLFTNGWGRDYIDAADSGSPSFEAAPDQWTVTKLDVGWRLKRTFTFTLPEGGALRETAHIVVSVSRQKKSRTITMRNGIVIKGATLTQASIESMNLQKQVTLNTTGIDFNSKAIALKADQTAVDKLNDTTQQNSAELQLTAKQVDLKAAEQKIDAVSGEVDKNNAELSVHADEIEAKAEKSSVDTLSDTVKQQGVTVQHNSDELKTKAESSDVNTLSGQYNDLKSETEQTAAKLTESLTTVEDTANQSLTTANTAKQTADANTETIAQVKMTTEGTQTQVNSIVSDANGTKQEVSSIKTAIQTGGRNLLQGTSHDLIATETSGWGIAYGGTNANSGITVNRDMSYVFRVWIDKAPFDYHAEVYLWKADRTLSELAVHPILTGNTITAGNSGYSTVVISPSDMAEDVAMLRPDIAANAAHGAASFTVNHCQEKLELGDLATTWSPAPEDLATAESVHTVETTLTKSLDQLTNAQGQTASDLLTATNKLTTVEDTANKAKSQSSQNASDLLLRVEKADLLSEINLQAGSTLIKTGKLYLDAATVTFSGAAIIPSAAIMSLDATKITTGTLDASKATIINLNADSIVSGSIDTEKVTLKNLSASTIVSGELDASKVTVSNLSASNIIGGTLDANLVTVKDLSASSITSGTLNAGLLNVINLNADSITTGTLSGANLSMNLNTGEVLFTSGAITGTGMNMNLDSGVIDFTQGRFHDDAGTIDLNVDDGYIATSSGDSQMVLSQGKLLLTQKNIFDSYSATPYLQIANNVAGDSLASASIIGRDSVTVCNSANTGSIISMGVETLAGLFAGKATDGWKMTKVGGADRGVIISGGKMSGGALGDHSPSIVVGCDSSGGGKGRDRISIGASYVHIPSTYSRTISGSANVHVASDGALVRSTSAAKYKTDILRTTSSAIGHKLLGIQTATWIDKADQARYASDPNHYERPSRNFGMIADDLDAAGIPELVTYVDGEIEGINYDRIGPALVPVIRELNDKVNQLEALYNAIKNDKLTA